MERKDWEGNQLDNIAKFAQFENPNNFDSYNACIISRLSKWKN